MTRIPVLLDTDIGSNVDDLLALLLIAGSPELHLVGVNTVYGDTLLRARIAHRVLALLGMTATPVAAGHSEPISGTPVFWTGHEGSNYTHLRECEPSPHGIERLFRSALARYGESLVVVGIGPFTNLARLLEAEVEAGSSSPQLLLMGGQFGGGEPDRNVSSDAEAAARLIRSAAGPTTFVGIETCRRVWMEDRHLDQIVADGPHDLVDLIRTEIETWWQYKGERRSNPCDPLTVMALLRPDLFEFTEADIDFSTEPGPGHGATVITASPPGEDLRAEYAVDVDAEAVLGEIVGRISRAVRMAPR